MADIPAVTAQAQATPLPPQPAPRPAVAPIAESGGQPQLSSKQTPAPPTAAAAGTGYAAPAPPPTQTAPPPGTPVAIAESTADLASLPTPSTLAARVVATETGGRLHLETALGRIVTGPNSPALEPGATLRIQIDGKGVRLLPDTGQAGSARGGAQAPAQAATQAGAAATARTITSLAPGDVVQARLLPTQNPAPATPTASASTASQANPGKTAITVRVLAVGPAGAQAAQTSAAPAVGSSPAASGAALPTSPSQPGAILAATGPIQATVTGHAALGQPVLNFTNGTLLLEKGNLPVGAQVRLEVVASPRGGSLTAPIITPLTDAMDETLAALTALQPALAAAVDSGRVPKMGPKLTSSILFLMSALQGGGTRGLIGQEASQALQAAGRETLLKKLAEALGQRGPRLESDPASAGGEIWRTVYLPVSTAQGWQPLRVAWRDGEAEDDGEEGDDEPTRFQVDFSFSKLGPVRIDGLAGTGRLDLLIVSRARMASGDRAELETLFTSTIEAMGIRGHIRFVEQPELAAPEIRAEQQRHASATV